MPNNIRLRSDESPYKLDIKLEEEKLVIWNGNNGRSYSFAELAPFTDEDLADRFEE